MQALNKQKYDSPQATVVDVKIENNIMSMGANRYGYGTAEEEDWE